MPEAEIIYVDGVAGALSGPCTKASPCKTIQLGVDAAAGSRSHVRVAPGVYGDRVVIGGKTVQIFAKDVVAQVPLGPGIEVKGASIVLIQGLRVKDVGGGASGDGITCHDDGGNSPALTLLGVTIEGSSALGINANKCKLASSRSVILNNHAGGISLFSSDFSLVNNVIAKNGGPSSVFGGVAIAQNPLSGAAGATFQFNTVSDNNAPSTATSGVTCGFVTAPLSFGNSVIYGNTGTASQVEGAACSWRYSNIGPGGSTIAGDGNINSAPLFVNTSMNDYHLKHGSPGVDVADPAATVDVDIDGETRPIGGRSDMGADEVP